ncbi:probable leucine-rich repeat receptor-like protein kinase At1g35710 [Telopea speciosissima]|uniref:probable leucine-rich repeat receptor-like protein kinase At1g35710 n=1 Tax=Telopea speciosissima TaxID=54955 RepID=UPI001CC61A03|nr:probable leucine-rich repeat receptor-like protein kinase At1g35710 [Telopea speciosissima]
MLSKLTHLSLTHNKLTGSIPREIANLKNLNQLDLSHNKIIGSLPREIANLKNLNQLDLSYNLITGSIPREIGNLKNLNQLDLSENSVDGSIPPEIGNLKNLNGLYLFNNMINGAIPPEIGNLKNLNQLDLSHNKIIGSIPREIGNLKNLNPLDLSYNLTTGSIPREIGNLKNLNQLDLSENSVDGSIPLGNLKNLNELDLSDNKFTGSIPTEIGDLGHLTVLDLSHNKLNGPIPTQMRKLNLTFMDLDLCYNELKGLLPDEIALKTRPDSWNNNEGLCSHYWNPPCKGSKNRLKVKVPIILSISGIIILVAFVIVIVWFVFRQKSMNFIINTTRAQQNGDIFSIWNYDGTIAYNDIMEATEEFDIRYCIGTGGYGSVYIVKLPTGKVVAVKKLHRLEAEEKVFEKSFTNEIHVLTRIRHQNIVKLYGFCSHPRCNFLVYEYIERGSLAFVLGNEAEAVELDWKKRINVIKGIAHVLSYMQHDCTPPLIHRDISSNNVLLDADLEPHVADFGTSRFQNPNSSNRTILAGTYGYIAPSKLPYIPPLSMLIILRTLITFEPFNRFYPKKFKYLPDEAWN